MEETRVKLWYSVIEATKVIGCARCTVYTWIDNGKITTRKDGKLHRDQVMYMKDNLIRPPAKKQPVQQ